MSINNLTDEQIDAIFEQLNNDEKLNKQLEKITNNPNFDDDKKALFIKYRIDLAFNKLVDELCDEITRKNNGSIASPFLRQL